MSQKISTSWIHMNFVQFQQLQSRSTHNHSQKHKNNSWQSIRHHGQSRKYTSIKPLHRASSEGYLDRFFPPETPSTAAAVWQAATIPHHHLFQRCTSSNNINIDFQDMMLRNTTNTPSLMIALSRTKAHLHCQFHCTVLIHMITSAEMYLHFNIVSQR